MLFREHALMQNAGNQNACRLAPKEDDVLAYFPAIKAGTDMIAGAP